MAGLVASLASKGQSRAIENAGGFLAPEKPNRELRRRMAREAAREAKAGQLTKADRVPSNAKPG